MARTREEQDKLITQLIGQVIRLQGRMIGISAVLACQKGVGATRSADVEKVISAIYAQGEDNPKGRIVAQKTAQEIIARAARP